MTAADGADALVARDHGRLLWNLALAGAQVRRAAQVAPEWEPERLDLDGAPRAVLVATDAPTAGIADLLAAIAPPVAPVTVLRGLQVPRWAGAPDAAVVVSLDGRHPRLVALADQAGRRGCALLVVAPAGSPVATASPRAVVVDLPADTARRAAFFSAVGPVLVAAGRWRLTVVDRDLLPDTATALDEVAHRCRPSSTEITNPARALAEEFAETVPVVVSTGPLAAVAAEQFAVALRLLGGVTAAALHLPDDLAQVTALCHPAGGGGGADDFFRDRVDDPGFGPRLVLLADEGAADETELDAPGERREPLEREAEAAAQVVELAAGGVGIRVSTLDVPGRDPLVRCLAAVLLGAFTGAYLGLAQDRDPSAPRPGELS